MCEEGREKAGRSGRGQITGDLRTPLGSTDCIYHEGVEEPEQERSVTRIAF